MSTAREAITHLATNIQKGNVANACYWLGRCEQGNFIPTGSDYFADAAFGCDNLSQATRNAYYVELMVLVTG